MMIDNGGSLWESREKKAESAATTTAIAEEFMCAFCLDVLVQATTLVPCGHTFCLSCVKHKTCPTCRADINTTVPCRAMSNAIQAMTCTQSYFTQDDLEVYRQRVAASAPKQQEQDISHRILNCSRQLLLAASMCAAATASSDAVLSSSDFVIPLRRRTSSRQQQQQGIRSSDRSAVSAAAASPLLAAHLTTTAATTSRLFQPHRTPLSCFCFS
jgi:hypothetical protein